MKHWYEAQCFDCPSGNFSNLDANNGGNPAGNAGCPQCPYGKYQLDQAESTCDNCQTCTAGKYRDDCGVAFDGTCKGCVAGQFKEDIGAFWVTLNPGKAQWEALCTNCPYGKYSLTVNQTQCQSCAVCPSGQKRDNCGSVGGTTAGSSGTLMFRTLCVHKQLDGEVCKCFGTWSKK